MYLCRMTTELTDRKLKAQLDFFKIYSVFVIGLVTGCVNLFNSYLEKGWQSTLILLCVGGLSLSVSFSMFIIAIYKIKNLIK